MAASADTPLSASPTTSNPSASSNALAEDRKPGWSSTISTVSFFTSRSSHAAGLSASGLPLARQDVAKIGRHSEMPGKPDDDHPWQSGRSAPNETGRGAHPLHAFQACTSAFVPGLAVRDLRCAGLANVGVKLRPAACCAGSTRSGVPPVRFGLHIYPAARAYHPDLRAAVSHADRRRPAPERRLLARCMSAQPSPVRGPSGVPLSETEAAEVSIPVPGSSGGKLPGKSAPCRDAGLHGYRVTALELVARVDEAIGNGRTRCL